MDTFIKYEIICEHLCASSITFFLFGDIWGLLLRARCMQCMLLSQLSGYQIWSVNLVANGSCGWLHVLEVTCLMLLNGLGLLRIVGNRLLAIYLEKTKLSLLRRTGYPLKYNQIHLFHFICHHSTSCKMWCSLRHNGSRKCARGSYHLHYIKLDNNISSIWHWRINGKKFFPLSNVVHKTILMG